MSSDRPHDESGHRWFAALYDIFNRRTERSFTARHRERIVGGATGRVLEIGAGTGASFPYYKQAREVVAIEPDPHMLRRARQAVEKLGATNIQLHQHAAEAIPFEDHAFDHVVSTLVLCTVRDPARALAEIRRLLKPEGTFRFIEHVRYDGGLRGGLQDVIAPVWRWVGAGCNPNRRTLATIESAGFRVEELERATMSGFVPMIIGVAKPT